MKNLISLITIVFATCLYSYAQEKKTLYQLEANALINENHSVYKPGVGFTASALYPVSPSFNLGPSLSADFTGIRNTAESYTPISVRFSTVWFPQKLLNSILPSPVWSAFYFKAGLGHSFNYSGISNKNAINSSSFDFGLMFPASSHQFNIHAGLASFGIKNNLDNVTSNNSSLTTLGISYNLFKKSQPAK